MKSKKVYIEIKKLIPNKILEIIKNNIENKVFLIYNNNTYQTIHDGIKFKEGPKRLPSKIKLVKIVSK